MSDLREAAEAVLEAWGWDWSEPRNEALKERMEALRQALAQPEQRPVGTYEGVMETMLSLRKGTLEQQQIYTHMKDKLLYTAPPKREWVGLTDDEIHGIYKTHHDQYGKCQTGGFEYERTIEAKLKEKNT